MNLLFDISPAAAWMLEALVDDATRSPAPSWAAFSAFHTLRTRPPSAHPAFGTALLQWQRMVARFGRDAPGLAAQAFLAMPRATERAAGVAARVLELWVRHVPVPIGVIDRMLAVDVLPRDEAALVAEELALGAHEGGAPSPGILAQVATAGAADPQRFVEGRALAELERFARQAISAEALVSALAPGLEGPGGAPLPQVTVRLLGGLGHPQASTPTIDERLAAALAAVRLKAAQTPARAPQAEIARRVVSCARALDVPEIVALTKPCRAGFPAAGVALPSAVSVAAALAKESETTAVRVALQFPSLSGAAEQGRGLDGLVRWCAAREPDVRPEIARTARSALHPKVRRRWDALAGGALPAGRAQPMAWPDRLRAAMRSGEPLSRRALLAAARAGEVQLHGVLFDSPGGAGLLAPDGTLRNGVRSWPAPEALCVAHPVDLVDAERTAWQARSLAAGARAPLNQHFRELHRAGGQELGRTRLERLRGARLTPASLRLLSRRGWFPVLAPVEVAPELELGAWRVRLHAVSSAAGPCHAALSFWRGGAVAALSEVPERVFSEAWRDVDEALALGLTDSSFVPSSARAALINGLAPRLGLHALRVEADHVAFRVAGDPERITLHNARPASGELLADAEARALAEPWLPFDDDGGVAALLVGRILHRSRAASLRAVSVAEVPPAEPQEGT